MNKLVEPPGWGNDGITNFLDKARENGFATFVQSKELFARLINPAEAGIQYLRNQLS